MPPTSPSGFTPKEIRAFKIYAVILAAVMGGLAVVAPSGPGRTIGALLVIVLLGVPPLVIQARRRRKNRR
ncbi:hypothetical protein K0B96_00730 [Horticoccus luteus]|uniref:Uncharacterized protein n=1 Tax=Horticoccus luteus TaxID=2862869 RepID=A0A8F9TWR5_9BACT|nr:hypothetical protein [Horticoccus luteus]QYM79173.1 hypothetical protein K0B96_00730 [Horticoccus luteus]